LDIEDLQTFQVLAQQKNFTRTAEIQNLAQSTVTARIQKMEKELNHQLFCRKKREIELTDNGRIFLKYFKRILDLYKESIFETNTLQQYEDRLVLAYSETMNYFFLPLIKKFTNLYPSYAIKTIVDHSSNIIRCVSDDIAQIGYITYKPHHNNLSVQEFLEDEIILVANTEHPAAKLKEISINTLHDHKLLFLDWGIKFKNWYNEMHPFNQQYQIELSTGSQLVNLVGEEFFFGFVIKSLVKKHLHNGTLVRISIREQTNPIPWCIYTIMTQDIVRKPAVKKWIELTKKMDCMG